jgi:hypothetical protein
MGDKTTALNEVYSINNKKTSSYGTALRAALNHAAVGYDGFIYVVGGYLQDNNQEPSDGLFIYDPSPGEWRNAQ